VVGRRLPALALHLYLILFEPKVVVVATVAEEDMDETGGNFGV
jgi:hypothetical protein